MDKPISQDTNSRILIVDDEASIRLTFEMFLTREGYGPISTASTYADALSIIKEQTFDLIISDIVLEGEKGTDLLRKIREAGMECPVVMVTGFPHLDTAAEAVRYGAFDYISKPVNKETLLKFVRQALKHWRLVNEKMQLVHENEKYKRCLETIFSSVSDAIITIDSDMKIVQLNNTAKQWLQYSDDEPNPSLESVQNKMCESSIEDARQVLATGKPLRDHQLECIKPDGNLQIISLNTSPLEDERGEFNGVVLVARDITHKDPATAENIRNQFHGYVGASQVMQEVFNLIENVGKVDTAVLVTGESGTGKELAAEALHAESDRSNMPLVKVDCAAMPEELLESELFGHRKGAFTGADRDRPGKLIQADKGTLFLDEIGDVSPRMQLRLLRFLQEKTLTPVGQDTPIEVDVRIVAATNVNFTAKVKEGSFREDLYYRLKVVEIKLPPLRDRKGGIPILVHHFLSMFREKLKRNIYGISDQAMNALTRYSWPGNVRELRHMIERACVLCKGSTLSLDHFPEEIFKPTQQTEPVATTAQQNSGGTNFGTDIANLPPYISEEDEILEILKRARGNKTKAAAMLNINRSTLYRKMKKLGITDDSI